MTKTRYHEDQKQILEGMRDLLNRELNPDAYHGADFLTTIKELEDGVYALRLLDERKFARQTLAAVRGGK